MLTHPSSGEGSASFWQESLGDTFNSEKSEFFGVNLFALNFLYFCKKNPFVGGKCSVSRVYRGTFRLKKSIFWRENVGAKRIALKIFKNFPTCTDLTSREENIFDEMNI